MGFFDFLDIFLDFAVEEMEEAVYELYEEALGVTEDYMNDSDSANEGAAAIMNGSVSGAALDAVDSWEGDWPYVSASDMADAALGSHPVAEATWGGTIDDCAAQLEDIIAEAQEIQMWIEVLEAEEEFEEGEGEGEEGEFE